MKRDFEDCDNKKSVSIYIIMFILLSFLCCLLYCNVKLSEQLNALQQQISNLSPDNLPNSNYATKDDVKTMRTQLGNLQDKVYDINLKLDSIENTLDDITSFIGLDDYQQKERDDIINQIRQK